MTTVFFIRHGPTLENKEGRIQGQRPGTLLISETERYLAALTPLLREKKIDVLLSSDLGRAIATRTVLKNFLLQESLKEGMSPLLREKAMGYYEGMLWTEVPLTFQEQRGKDTFDFRTFGGENDEDVRQRVRYALREFALRYAKLRICCITHAGWIKQLARIADEQGIIPDQWTNRSAIYEAGIGPVGQLQYFHPVKIEAHFEYEGE
ncbi:MAG: histidine phosphatase family protein [Candidatus Andersenbacteria bacterium]